MNRIGAMKIYLLPLWNKRFEKNMNMVQGFFSTHQEKIVKSFCDHIVTTLIKEAIKRQEEKDQECISSFVISYLYSSLLTGTHDYEFSLFSGTPFTDENGISTYWRAMFLYQCEDEDESFIKRELSKKFIRVEGYEVQALKELFFECYKDLAQKYFKTLTDELKKREEFNYLKKTNDFTIFYGDHMGILNELQ